MRAPPPRLGRLAAAAAAALPLLVLPRAPAAAQDEPIELADDPFEITDPIAAAPGAAELGVVGPHERARRGRVRGTTGVETELEIGVAPRLELRIGQGGAYGNLETRRRLDAAAASGPEGSDGEATTRGAWGGETRLGLLYQVTEARRAVPTIGVLGRVRAVYGPGRPAQEAEGVLLIGTTLGRAARPLGLHLNLGWVARFDPLPGERPNRLFANLSAGQAVTGDTALVLTYAREQQERGSRDYELLQVGLRHRLSARGPVLGLAVGAGLNRDSPRW